ncbi:amino acid/polyamine transporter I [Xylariales sp. AK1849]|nr:amino acid/polyamine transporter I [Xylariales sp. AK1849]
MATEFKSDLNVEDVPAISASDVDMDAKAGNAQDRRDMLRMGKTQELRRSFSFVSIFGFSMILQQSWEASLSVAAIGLKDGGSAGLIWVYLVCWIGFIFVNLSMAEQASMAPTTGGQYHWVSEFAPRKHQRFLSYIMGWLCVLGWQTSCASTAYVAGTQIQGLVVLNYPNYVYEAWHGTLLTIAIAGFAVFFNIALARKLPLIEAIILVIHVFAFFGIIVALWVLAPKSTAKEVFTTFSDPGWGSLGASALIGITASILPLLGADAAVHMSEELRDAGRTLPRTMIATTVLNGAFGWVMVITFCFCLGNLEDILASPTGYPFLQVFYNATRTTSGATAMGTFVVAMTCFANLTAVATASRQLWAFSRDKALPFSAWFSRVHPGTNLPINSICTTMVITALLSLINIGSPVALNSITSLSTTSLLSSYLCSIGCMIWRRGTNHPILPSQFSLGKWGFPINIVSEAFLAVAFVFAFFPLMPAPDAANMNWNILIYGIVMVGSLAYYCVARHQYEGPVEYVRKLD